MRPAKNRRPPKKARARAAKIGKRERAARAGRLAALPYDKYLKTLHWAQTRAKALARWGGWCENCGTRPATEVHHKTYARLGRERPDDLAPLCAECHRAEHVRAHQDPRNDHRGDTTDQERG